MTSELTVTVIRLGYLVLLWVFVFAALTTLQRDLWGTIVTPRGKGIPRREERKGKKNPAAHPTHLLVTEGSLVGTTMPLGASAIVIGRSPSCTLVIDDSYASSTHARIFRDQDTWYVEDMRSTNGTFVDGERITSARKVGPGITIRIGQTCLELVR
ncbi:MAG: FHA domain-containing protein [Actinomycetaceae bacterium]|nr:FHA domain-containing protein [Actinomycetaceae bacterium]